MLWFLGIIYFETTIPMNVRVMNLSFEGQLDRKSGATS
jgi:hypothetical protein